MGQGPNEKYRDFWVMDFWRNSFYDRFPAAFLEAVSETQNELSTDKIVDFSQPPGK